MLYGVCYYYNPQQGNPAAWHFKGPYIEHTYFVRVFSPSDLESSFVRPLSATPLMEILGLSIDTENDFFCTIVRVIHFPFSINDFIEN